MKFYLLRLNLEKWDNIRMLSGVGLKAMHSAVIVDILNSQLLRGHLGNSTHRHTASNTIHNVTYIFCFVSQWRSLLAVCLLEMQLLRSPNDYSRRVVRRIKQKLLSVLRCGDRVRSDK